MNGIDELLHEVNDFWDQMSADRALRRRIEAPAFNIFNFLRRDEYGLSSVIAWMLDPKSSHGQDSLFLQLFISIFGVRVQLNGGPVTVKMEAATHKLDAKNRRIDVHIKIGDFILAIENKPWAQWQINQVRDYLQNINVEGTDGHCLVVLRGYGDCIPVSQLTESERDELIEQGHLVDANYPLLRDWMVECATRCEAVRVKLFLNEFADMIATTFGAVKMTTDDQILAKCVLGSENVSAALKLISATDTILTELAARCYAEIAKLSQNKIILNKDLPNPLSRHTGFSFELDASAPFTFCVEFNELRLTSPYFGLKLRGGLSGRRPHPDIKTAIEANGMEAGLTEPYWIWWNWAEKSNFGLREENVATTWQALADGSFARLTVEAALRIDKALRDAKVLPWMLRKP